MQDRPVFFNQPGTPPPLGNAWYQMGDASLPLGRKGAYRPRPATLPQLTPFRRADSSPAAARRTKNRARNKAARASRRINRRR